MANVKTTMTDIRVIIREFSRGTSLREMERELKLSRTSLRTYRNRSESSGLSMIDLLKAIMLTVIVYKSILDNTNFFNFFSNIASNIKIIIRL